MSDGKVDINLKAARIRACTSCHHCVLRGGDNWQRCWFDGEMGAPEINTAFYNGPAANCSDGRWERLEPVDLAAEAAATLPMRAVRAAALFAPFAARLAREEFEAALVEATAAGAVDPDVAAAAAEAISAAKP